MIYKVSVFEIMSEPKAVKVPYNDTFHIRIQFKQKNINTQEITQADYSDRSYKLLSKKVGDEVITTTQKCRGNWLVTTK
jgi:hypothetical protein